jgi:alpha-N-arabinofuranosidase
MKKTRLFLLFFLMLFGLQAVYLQTTITVETKKPLFPVQPTMYGVFFEDINYGADGGLYAEMIKNRSFEFPQNLMGWKVFGTVNLKKDGPFERNPHYVRLTWPGHDHKHTGIENEGFFGIAVTAAESYRFSVWARASSLLGSEETIRIEIVGNNSNVITQAQLTVDSKEWKRYEVELRPRLTDAKAKLRIFLTSKGSLDLEHVSLFPVETWKKRENGLRKDLAQALYDLNPGVFRFPGGCIVEGTDLQTRYDWKKSVGPVENRPLNENRWHYTFPHRFFPDYFQSYGMGFFEYFLLSKDLRAEPIPIVSVGLACQFQNECCEAHVPVGELEDYIQDALDLIEFANGDVSTTWGRLRSEMGHPEPFNLKYIGVGNEQWGPEYPVRLEPFMKAIRARYPDILIIGGSGPGSEGEQFEYLWPEMKRLKVDLVDEHYYRPESWFLAQGARYDNYDRKGPKVFAGEYACHPRNRKNNFESALMEAAFMTGLERNADIVHMATYAPLFAHVEGWQWRPDLIWFDNLNSVRSINYYVQQLYGQNPGTHVLRTYSGKEPLTGQDGLFASSTVDQTKNQLILKIANTDESIKAVNYDFKGLKPANRNALCIQMTSPDLDWENTLEEPDKVIPQHSNLVVSGNSLAISLPAKSFTLIIIDL